MFKVSDDCVYPDPEFSMNTFLIWFSFIDESALFLIALISELSVVSQSAGTGTYSIESNFTISLG